MKVYFLIAECSLSSAKILKIEGDSLEKVEEFQIIPQKKCGFRSIFIRKSVTFTWLFVRKSVTLPRLFVRKSVNYDKIYI